MANPVAFVRGKQIEYVEPEDLGREAACYDRVIVDVGTGDGKFAYRQALANPRWLCIGADANAEALRETSVRAQRRPERGGAPNALFVRACISELPGGLEDVADEIHVNFPWGSLLQAVMGRRTDDRKRCPPDPRASHELRSCDLSSIARIGRCGARFYAVVNVSALEDP